MSDASNTPVTPPCAADEARPPGAVTTAVVPFEAIDAAGFEHWRRLANRAAEPNPFFRPEFVRAAVAGYDNPPLVVVAATGDEWVACLPLVRASGWRRLKLPCLASWAPDLVFFGTPLVDRDRVDEGTAALARFIAREKTVAAVILDPIDPDGAVGAGLGRALAAEEIEPVVYADFERATIDRRPEPTYLEEAMGAKRRKELRRLRRGIGRELGAEVAAVDRSGDPEAYQAFLDMELSSWKGKAGTALASTSGGAAFFRSMCAAAHERGDLELLALEVGGRTVGMQCNLLDGDALFGFKVAYDESLSRFSPGALLEVDAIQIFHESRRTMRADSCAAPDNEMINRIWPDRRRLQTQIVPTRTRRAALIRPQIAAERVGRRVARGARRRLGRFGRSSALGD